MKKITLKVAILITAIMALSGCVTEDMSAEVALEYLVRQIESNNLYRYRLTMYYFNLATIPSPPPRNLEDVKQSGFTTRITVGGEWLSVGWWDYELIDRLNTINLTPLGNRDETPPLPILHYVFETTRGRKIFDVTMFSRDGGVFINGLEVEWNDVFYDIIRWHLPIDATYRMDRASATYADFWDDFLGR